MTTSPALDDVEDRLTSIIERAQRDASALGIFPAMYRQVTRTVVTGLDRGVFGDAVRVEALVVTFAGLYLDAYDADQRGDAPPQCWALAFEFARRGRGSVAQHLLLGMNAHINLDLGIATAAVSTPADLPALHGDFVRVNDVLFALLDALQDGLDAVSPWMHRLDRVGLGLDEALMRSGIALARSRAWSFSEALVVAEGGRRSALIDERDLEARRLGQLLSHRLSALHLANRVVAMREPRDVAVVIDAMTAAEIDVSALASPAVRPYGGGGGTGRRRDRTNG